MQGSENIEQRVKPKAIPRLVGQVDLRDYFAAKAMQGALAMEGGEVPLTAFESVDVQAIADACYAMADAMLAAREKRDE